MTDNILKTFQLNHSTEHPISLNLKDNIVYVANPEVNTISAINIIKNKINNIPLQGSPSYIDVNPNTGILYVADKSSNIISMIDIKTNKLMIGLTFSTNPSNAGTIVCDGKTIRGNEHVKIDNGTLCNTIANPTFKFDSWYDISNLKEKSDKIFNASNYGSVTARFIPSQVGINIPTDLLIAVIIGPGVGALLGWLIPFEFERLNKKKQLKDLKILISTLDRTYESSKQNREKCLEFLLQQRIHITTLLEEDKIDDSTFQILNDRISQYVDEINNA